MCILSGRVVAGTRLPSSRQLASALKISRNTIATAYENLQQEGLLESSTGSGTYVHRALPVGAPVSALDHKSRGRQFPSEGKRLSARGRKISGLRGKIGSHIYRSNAFRPRLPALDVFPSDVWSKLISRRWRNMPANVMANGDPPGYYPLREIIASYLRDARGISCDTEQVIVVTGTPQATTLAATVLLDQNDPVWIEDPGYPRVRVTLMAADANLIPVPLDEEGFNLKAGLENNPPPKMIYVTPSHQYPMGMSMSLARRLQLSQWSQATGTWIVEDDYGTEFRSGIPIAALQGFGSDGRVIYIGGFANVLFPALRVGYIVVPDDLVDAFVSARILIDRSPSLFGQMVLSDFIAENHFERHLKKLRAAHAERHQVLTDSLQDALGSDAGVLEEEPGMQIILPLPDHIDDTEVSVRILDQDIEAPPLSFYTIDEDKRGLVLGYAAADTKMIRIGVNRMIPVIHDCLARPANAVVV